MDDVIKGIANVTSVSARTVELMALKLGIDTATCTDADLRKIVEALVKMREEIRARVCAGPPRIRCNGSVLPGGYQVLP